MLGRPIYNFEHIYSLGFLENITSSRGLTLSVKTSPLAA
jgi:hypothetical protein